MKKLILLVCVCGGATGCMKKVPANLIDKLPYESKIELLEAENDLAIAVDRQDEAKATIIRTRDQIRRAKDRRGEAKSEVGAANDENSKAVAELAVVEADARVEYLRAQQKVNSKEEDIADQNLKCALARFESARLAAAKKVKLEGAESLSQEAFDNQVKNCEKKVAEMKEAEKEQLAASEAAKSTWDKTKDALAKKTFDARASPYVE
jgi:hypothetical protein